MLTPPAIRDPAATRRDVRPGVCSVCGAGSERDLERERGEVDRDGDNNSGLAVKACPVGAVSVVAVGHLDTGGSVVAAVAEELAVQMWPEVAGDLFGVAADHRADVKVDGHAATGHRCSSTGGRFAAAAGG